MKTKLIAQAVTLLLMTTIHSSICQADPVTPLYSRVSSLARLAGDDFKVFEQTDSLDPVSASSTRTFGGMTITTLNEATWNSAASADIRMDLTRLNGTHEELFATQAFFIYDFELETEGSISIDYLFEGATPNAPFGAWWAMQGYSWTIDGVDHDFNYAITGGVLEPGSRPDPIVFEGTFDVPLDAGTHRILLEGVGSATGDIPGDRFMTGQTSFQISTGAVPEPGSCWLLGVCGVWFAGLRRRRKCRANS